MARHGVTIVKDGYMNSEGDAKEHGTHSVSIA
jgi:hypothetical protein